MSANDTAKSATSMRTPLGRVRGRGAAHGGTSDFFRQRLTAVAMVVLFVPVIIVILSMIGRNQAGAAAILGSPLVAIIMILFIIAAVWHMKIGMQVIIEDYVKQPLLRVLALLANSFFSALVGIASAAALLKITFGA